MICPRCGVEMGDRLSCAYCGSITEYPGKNGGFGNMYPYQGEQPTADPVQRRPNRAGRQLGQLLLQAKLNFVMLCGVLVMQLLVILVILLK